MITKIRGAALYCGCPLARALQRKRKTHRAIEHLCVTDAEKNGFEQLANDVVSKVKDTADAVIKGTIETASLRVSDEEVIRIKMDMKTGIVFVRRTRKIEMETS